VSSHSHDEESKGYSPHMRGVALGILVMGISLAVIIILWIEFGHRGPAFSTQIMQQQQESLRKQYGLPPQPQLSPEMLEVPPSLRSITAGANATTTAGANATTTAGANATTTAGANATTTAGANATTTTAGANATTTAGANATTTAGANATTTAGANATTTAGGITGNTTGTSATGAGGGTSVSIVSGSSSLTDTAYQPNPIQVSVGTTVTWTNNDSQPHTVTSGSNVQPDGKFDSSPNFNPLMAPGQTFSHTFTEAGEYPYYCALHPNMVGTVSVS
jgi:plastocyanin